MLKLRILALLVLLVIMAGIGSYLLQNPAIMSDKSGLILTSFFRSRKDPQVHMFPVNRSIEVYCEPFFSQARDAGLSIVVFVDQLGEDDQRFFKKHGAEAVLVELFQDRSLNDERFRVYHKYLEDKTVLPDYLLFMDVSDIQIFGNPFREMDKYPKFSLFIQPEGKGAACTVMAEKFQLCGLPNDYKWLRKSCKLWNAGIWGGHTHAAMKALKKMVDILYKDPRLNHRENCNMPVVNHVLHAADTSKIYSEEGWLFSPFKKCTPKGKHILYHKALCDEKGNLLKA